MKLLDMRKQHKFALDKAEKIVSAMEATGRKEMNGGGDATVRMAMSAAKALEPKINSIQSTNTMSQFFNRDGALLMDGGLASPGSRAQKPMSADYTNAFVAFLRSGGKQASSALSEGFDPLFGGFALPSLPGMSSAMYEGTLGSSNGAGGYAVNVPTDGQIIPLAVPDLGVRSVARVIPTATDVKLPSQSTFGTAGIKAESGASTNTFSESDPTLSQLTLSAFMMGLTHTFSWELLQDVSLFQEFGVRDLINAVSIAEDGFFVTGTGTGQPQGLVGNTGTGTASPYVVESTGNLFAQRHGRYSWHAQRVVLPQCGVADEPCNRRCNSEGTASSQSLCGLWTREGGRDFLHGFPVSYSAAMPAIPTATSAGVVPILFGSFPTAT
jgi:HK97 family phage major capsid protein